MNTDINFEYVEDFTDYIYDMVADDEDLFVAVVAKFEEAQKILKSAMAYGNVNFDYLHIESPLMAGYEDEYVLDFWMNDETLEIGCEPLKRDGEYINPCGDITFIFDNVSSKVIPLCEGSEVYFVETEEEDECNEDCHACCECDCRKDNVFVECSTDNGGDTHGFTASKSDDSGYYSFSYYTTDKLSNEDIRSMLKEYGF